MYPVAACFSLLASAVPIPFFAGSFAWVCPPIQRPRSPSQGLQSPIELGTSQD